MSRLKSNRKKSSKTIKPLRCAYSMWKYEKKENHYHGTRTIKEAKKQKWTPAVRRASKETFGKVTIASTWYNV